MITQDELDGVKTILSMKEACILQLEQELAAATARATGLEQDFKGLLHKADSWERGMEWNAQLCAEKDVRIAQLESANHDLKDLLNDYEDAHLVEDGDYPEDEARIEMVTYDEMDIIGYYDHTTRTFFSRRGQTIHRKMFAWRHAPDLYTAAQLKRECNMRRAAEAAAAAGGEANNG